MLKQNYYNAFFDFGQQKINFSFFELSLPDDDPVYTLKNVMEELDFTGLLACYSDKGRTGFNPIMLYAIGRNIMKYHRFLQHEIEKYEGKKEQKTA